MGEEWRKMRELDEIAEQEGGYFLQFPAVIYIMIIGL